MMLAATQFSCVALIAVAIGPHEGEPDGSRVEIPEEVTFVRAAYDRYLDDAEYVGDFVIRIGEADSLEDGAAGRFTPGRLGGTTFELRGVVAKSGDRVRVRAVPNIAPKLRGNRLEGDYPFDQSAAGEITVTWYLPFAGENGQIEHDYVVVEPHRGTPGRTAGAPSVHLPSPVTITGGAKVLNPFDWDGETTLRGYAVETRDGRLRVRSTYEFPGVGRYEKTTVWRTDGEEPVLERVETADYTGPKDAPPLEDLIVASDFVRSGGLLVPRVVRRVDKHANGRVEVREFVSENLGERLPTDDDFVVAPDEGTSIIGLAETPAGPDVRLDPAAIRVADLSEEIAPRPLDIVQRNLDARRPWLPWLAWGLALSAAAAAVAVVIRRRREA